jgi:hypothetical protein
MTDWMVISAEAEAKLDNALRELDKLKSFYDEVINLTVRHDVIESTNGNEYASVSPKNLAKALAAVDENWYERYKSGRV